MSVGVYTPYAATSTNGGVISAVPYLLSQIGGYNSGGADCYIQLFQGAVGAGMFQSFKVPASASFSWDPAFGGRKLTALAWGISSTSYPTYTALVGSAFVFAEGLTQ
jgi:hypothetical protein